MNLLTGETSDAWFGGSMTPAVQRLLQKIPGAAPAKVQALLWTAQASNPDCLPVYHLLYKFHATHRQFDLAERAARTALIRAARQANLPDAWQTVAPTAADFSSPGPARFWLFSLKALAFILLRQGRTEEAREALEKIRSMNGADGLGDEVILALLDGSGRG